MTAAAVPAARPRSLRPTFAPVLILASAAVMLFASFVILLAINLLERWSRSRGVQA